MVADVVGDIGGIIVNLLRRLPGEAHISNNVHDECGGEANRMREVALRPASGLKSDGPADAFADICGGGRGCARPAALFPGRHCDRIGTGDRIGKVQSHESA